MEDEIEEQHQHQHQHHHQHQHQHQHQYGIGIGNMGRHQYGPPPLFSTSTAFTHLNHLQSDSTSANPMPASACASSCARWARQETMTLLEVRSRLDHKFKEANHKAPLWDQISRIMCEEHGYQRSGKKCREKFENLYKYFKKTKDGKAGRQDGKHYRFFRQLEALYGETDHNHSNLYTSAAKNDDDNNNNNITNNQHQFHSTMDAAVTRSHHGGGFRSISLSNDSSSEIHTSSSDDNNLDRGGGKRSWKSKIKDLIDLKMRKIMEKQEAWLEKTMKTVEHKEKERMSREEEWRSHESERVERERKLWTKERAWIEARDRAFMDGLQKLISDKELGLEDKDLLSSSDQSKHEEKKSNLYHEDRWAESEITELIQLKARMDARFEHCGGYELEGHLWDEIATRMTCLGYDQRRAEIYKDKYWELISAGQQKSKECHKKRKENWRIESVDCSNSSHHQQLQTGESNRLYSYGGEISGPRGMGLVPPEIGLGGGGGGLNPMTDSFKFLLGNDGDSHLLGSYGIKPNKGN